MDQSILYLLLIVTISFGLTITVLIDIILKDFGSTRAKIFWHFIALIPIIGWLIYLVFGFKKGTRHKPGA